MRAGKIRRRLCRSVFGRADQKCCGECKSAAVVSMRYDLGRDFWENDPRQYRSSRSRRGKTPATPYRTRAPGVLLGTLRDERSIEDRSRRHQHPDAAHLISGASLAPKSVQSALKKVLREWDKCEAPHTRGIGQGP